VDGDLLRRVAKNGSIPQDDTLPLTREVITGRVVLDGGTIQITDAQAETGEYPEGSDRARRVGHRTILAVPLIRAGHAIGVISIRRTEIRPFSHRQIELLKMFAGQAVIAIENTRLFEEVQTRTKELTETLEYQTATSDVLSVISRSKFDLQPVLQSVRRDGRAPVPADNAIIYRLEDDACRFAAGHGHNQEAMEAVRARPHPIDSGTVVGRAIGARATIQIEDVQADPLYQVKDLARRAETSVLSLGFPSCAPESRLVQLL
jgi:two-component system NtrC family sensor kinase